MAKGARRKSGGGAPAKAAKKKSRAKSRKHALRSATYAVKKLIDSAIAAGQPGDIDEAALARMRKKSVRRAAAATARLVEAAIAEDRDGTRRGGAPVEDESDDADDDASSRSGSGASLTAVAAEGSASILATIDDALRTAKDEAQSLALLEGASLTDDAPEPVAEGAQFLEDAFAAAGGEFVDESAARWSEFWASAPTVVGVDAEGTHFSPPLLVQVAADTMRGRVLLVAPTGNPNPDLDRLLGDAAITKVFFGDPRHERLGAVVRNAVDVQAGARPALRGDKWPRGLADVAGTLLRGAPYAKHKRLQKSFGFYRHRPDFALSHSRHWLSPEQRRYAAADAWATLGIHAALVAAGRAPAAVSTIAAEAPSNGEAERAPPPRADALRALARGGEGTHVRFGDAA